MKTLKVIIAIIYFTVIIWGMILAVMYNAQGETLKGIYHVLYTILLVLFLKD